MSDSKIQIISELKATITALNGINVCGKQNLANLYGSISMLEEVTKIIEKSDVTDLAEKKDEGSDKA